jgi:thiol:disulfide interchange protein DsbC
MFIRNVLLTGIIVSLLLLSGPGVSFSAEKKDAAATTVQAQVLSKDEALTLLKELAPDIKILEIRESVVNGLWEVGVESGGKKAIVYIDSSKKYMIQGAIIDLKAKTNLTQERFNELSKVDISLIPLDDAIVMGDKGAANRVIIFTDPDCPYCGKLHQEVKKVLEKRKDIAFFIKMFPLKIHPDAYDKAKTIVCEKSSALLDDAFEKKSLPNPGCTTTAVDENLKLGEKIGITGTPAIILQNGILIPGYKDADSLIALIDKYSGKK